jgi:isoaspartyl peptidase/L-asparaginase-like protein (Ntn-hydrolase superfamily)
MQEALERLSSLGAHGGLIAVNAAGEICVRHNCESMLGASVCEGQAPQVCIL